MVGVTDGGWGVKTETKSYATRARGRPKDEHRRRRILEAARDLFLEHGMQAVAMDTIAAVADVSNRTVYSHFSSKEALLRAVISHEAEALRPQFAAMPPCDACGFRQQLIAFGEAFIRLLSTPSIIGLVKLVISESGRHPDLAKDFYHWGPKQTQKKLAQYLQVGIDRGWLPLDDGRTAARSLIGLWVGVWHLEQQLGLRKALTATEARRHAETGVAILLPSKGARD